MVVLLEFAFEAAEVGFGFEWVWVLGCGADVECSGRICDAGEADADWE